MAIRVLVDREGTCGGEVADFSLPACGGLVCWQAVESSSGVIAAANRRRRRKAMTGGRTTVFLAYRQLESVNCGDADLA